MNESASGILTPRKIVDYKDVLLSVYSVDDTVFWWDAWKSGECIDQGAAKAIFLTEDQCLKNAMQWVDAFIFCDEDGAVSMESAKANGEKHIAVNGSKQDAVVNIQKAISIAKEALTWLCCDCFREKNPFFIKEVSRTPDRMYWMVQVCWAEGEEMRLSKELTIESKTGEVVGVKSYDTI